MKSRALFAVILLAVLTAIPTMASAAGVHYFDCDMCHRTDATWNTIDGSFGVCITCHDAAGDPAFDFGSRTRPDDSHTSGVIPPGFASGDASNAFGSNPAPGNQTSHAWGASDRNLAAGASPASNAMYSSRRGASNGFVSCYKCHDPHTLVDADYVTGNEKMLRTAYIAGSDGTSTNSEKNVEAMCVECHLDWTSLVAADRGLKSHPMIPDYPAFVAAQAPTNIRYKTFDGSGEMALLDDGSGAVTVGCTTCHGLHNADSDSLTAGVPGAAGVGDGMLLKGDGAASDPTGNVLCTSCHLYMGHPSSTGPATEIGCLVCHSGHSYNDGTPNVFVLRSMIDVPAGTLLPTQGTTIGPLRYETIPTTATEIKELYAGLGGDDGFCTGCHGLLTDSNPGMPSEIQPHTGNADEDCSQCHAHFDPANPTDQSWAGKGCNGCHGYPPTENAAGNGANAGWASDLAGTGHDYSSNNGGASFANESTAPHDTHAANNPIMANIDCKICHNAHVADFATQHNNAGTGPTFENVLEGAYALPSIATGGGALAPTYDGNTCSAVYCHSNGTGSAVPADSTDEDWALGNGTITGCDSCHDDATSDIGGVGPKGNSAAHSKHVTRFSCNVCHDDIAIDGANVDIAGGKHINGSVELKYDTTYNLGSGTLLSGSVASPGNCTVNCHSNGATILNPTTIYSAPDWSSAATGACGSCHKYDLAGVETGAGPALRDAHTTHVFDANGPQLACTTCHTNVGSGADHVNGEVSLVPTLTTVCNACHGATVAGVGVDDEPEWVTPSTVSCETCHSGVQAVINAATAPLVAEAAYDNGHGKAGVAQVCTDCHTAAGDVNHLGGAATTRLSGALPAYVAGNDVAFCTDCHGATTNNHSAIDGTICKTCHAQHGEVNGFDAMIMSNIAGNTVTGFTTQGSRASYANAANTGICQTCHVAGTVNYFNKTDDFATFNASHNFNSGQACSDCHTHSSTPKAFAGAGNACDACHGFPPATAAHDLHAPDSNLLGTPVLIGIDRSSCAACHTGADLYTYVPADDQISGTPGRLNHNVSEASQDATLLGSVGYTGSNCTNACHDGASGVTAAWTDASLACDACHYQAADPTQAGNTGATPNDISAGHNAHFAGGGAVVCTDCHNAVADTTHITDRSGASEFLKVQGMATAVQAEALIIAGAGFNTGTDSCATASCHNDARPGADVPTSAWGTDDANCTQCHAAAPSTGSHDKHIPVATDCSDCHTSALQDTSYNSTSHYDDDIDVAAGNYPTNKLINSGFSSCTTASCHDDGRSANTTPNWGTPAADACVACHDAIPATGSHATHVADAAVACTDCHAGAVQSTTKPTAGHDNGSIDVTAAHTYNAATDLGGAFDTCSTASCHNDGRNSGLTGTWGTPIGSCAECHETVPTTGGHGAHVGVSFAGAAIACADCHTGAVQGSTAPTANHRDGDTNATSYPVTTNGGAFQNCATATCHQTGQTVNDYTVTSAWGADDTNCTQCHAAVPATGSHATHVTTASYDCSQCHTNATKDISYNDANHGDVTIDVAVGNYITNRGDADYGTAPTTCDTISCHGDGLNAGGGNTPIWGANAGCAACHDTITDGTGSHAIHLTYTSNSCVECHDNADVAGTSPGQHGDGDVDVFDSAAGDLGYPQDAAIGSTSWNGCTAASCHDDGRSANTTPNWNVTPATCTACHDAIPATGSHASHVADAAVACTDCHAGAVQSSTKPTAGHDNGSIDVTAAHTYNAATDLGGAFDTCSTASCHNDGRNSGLTGTWGTPLANCAECHAVQPGTGSHTTHLALFACATCHTGVTEGSTAGAGHRDGNITTAASTGLGAKAIGTAFTSCGTNDCHGSGSPVWGANTANDQCTKCHGELVAGPATAAQMAPGGAGVDTNGDSVATDTQVGAHQIHLNPTMSKVVACSACHTVPGTVTSAGHIDSALPAELTFGGLALGGLDGQPPVAPAGCATTYCHDGSAIKNGGAWGNGTLAPVWTNTGFVTGAAADCDNCHGYPPADAHPANSNCTVCHDVLTGDNVTFTAAGKLTHVDGIVQASGGDTCTDCHAADIDGGLSGVHGSHADTATFLAGKTVSGGDYGTNGWYGTTYVSGQPVFGCGQCHPAAEGTGHPTAGLNVDIDPAGETPGAGNVKTFNVAQNTPTMISRASVTCASVYCHSDASGTFKTTPDWYGGALPTNGTECASCHGNSPTTAAHGVHEVGIHYEELYNGTSGLLAASDTPGNDAAHGDPAVSSTITCYTCHSGTVTDTANAANSTCLGCHSDTNSIVTGDELARILSGSSTHINGLKDVVFADLTTFKSKAQLRDNLADADDGSNLLSAIWNRITGYKGAADYDTAQAAFATPVFTQGADTCSTVACHNGNTATWSDNGVDCMYCHTSLPK
jgi:predicted CxxxxCH...CXXCH cytochrome family protein